MIIDTHHHFWNYDPVEYDWIDEEMKVIRRSFLPSDLKMIVDENKIDGVISVQARQTIEETDWLLNLAKEIEIIKGIVGWLPLASDEIYELLKKYAINPWLKSIRHVVQGEVDPEFILGEEFNRGISFLKEFNLVYDILIFAHQLPSTIRFVQQHPDQQFVLDHIAKPNIKDNKIKTWAKNLKDLGHYENVACKISGLVTEADFQYWTEEQLVPYLETVLEVFGPNRLMFGSDWPVCLVASQYGDWLQLVKRFLSKLSKDEQELIFYKNAKKIYQI